MNETQQLITVALAIAPLASAFTAVYKRYTPATGKLLPVLSVVTGVILGVIWALVFKHADVPMYALGGLISGFASGGFYNLVKPGSMPTATINVDAKEIAKALADNQKVDARREIK